MDLPEGWPLKKNYQLLFCHVREIKPVLIKCTRGIPPSLIEKVTFSLSNKKIRKKKKETKKKLRSKNEVFYLTTILSWNIIEAYKRW